MFQVLREFNGDYYNLHVCQIRRIDRVGFILFSEDNLFNSLLLRWYYSWFSWVVFPNHFLPSIHPLWSFRETVWPLFPLLYVSHPLCSMLRPSELCSVYHDAPYLSEGDNAECYLSRAVFLLLWLSVKSEMSHDHLVKKSWKSGGILMPLGSLAPLKTNQLPRWLLLITELQMEPVWAPVLSQPVFL